MNDSSVFKYPIDPSSLDADSGIDLMLRRGSRPLYAAVQGDGIVLYAVVNHYESGIERWRVYVVGTGHPLEFYHEEYKSMGLAVLAEGQLMFHVFISKKPSAP